MNLKIHIKASFSNQYFCLYLLSLSFCPVTLARVEKCVSSNIAQGVCIHSPMLEVIMKHGQSHISVISF